MGIFTKKPTTFITLEIDSVPGLFDYPKHLPIPRIDEVIIFESHHGKVREVRHMTSGTVHEVKIVCGKI
ncbi:MAG: hypothetical protein QY309_04725 [Cyclobacteriaceae bacterium]|nr:MAG: hypothetical protein QY309_04725 [Cyclobacteriaceae bacterium]